MLDLDYIQKQIHVEAHRRWPNLDVVSEGLALAEEAGEVCRAILKRKEGTRGTKVGWTEELAKELGQTLLVILNMAAEEGLSAEDILVKARNGFFLKPDRED